jgi:agmatine deiminase
VILDWSYNAWGMKYLPFENDDYIPTLVAGKLGLPVRHPEMVLEGGSIDVNGAGALMTTRSCLLHPNRNPELSKEQIEQTLRDWLGVRQIIWLGDGIAGDDTDGHVDDLTRFVSENRIVTVVEENDDDENFEPLARNLETLRQTTLMGHTPLEVTTLPMPSAIFRDGQRLPASYANFYIANTVVLLPVFADTADRWACAVLENLFPGRTIVPIDCRELIWGLGAFHCLTQQQPLAPKR